MKRLQRLKRNRRADQGHLVTITVLVDGYCTRPDCHKLSSCTAKALRRLRFKTPAKVYSCETLLEWLAQHLKDMAAELGPFIQEEHAIVGQRHFTRHRHVAAADQPRIRDGVVGRATRPRRDQRCAVASEAGDAVDTCGLNRLGEGHRREDGREAACQPRLATARVEPEEMMVRTPAQPSAVPPREGMGSATTADVEPGAIQASPRMTSASHMAHPL
jgi:hypothetical protein